MLCGCKKTNSQALILDAYEAWKQMNMDVWIIGPSMTEEEICKKNKSVLLILPEQKL